MPNFCCDFLLVFTVTLGSGGTVFESYAVDVDRIASPIASAEPRDPRPQTEQEERCAISVEPLSLYARPAADYK